LTILPALAARERNTVRRRKPISSSFGIYSASSFEPLDLSQARFNRALMFALPVSFILWGLIGLAIWGLISVFF
jgi:hypothetical protein